MGVKIEDLALRIDPISQKLPQLPFPFAHIRFGGAEGDHGIGHRHRKNFVAVGLGLYGDNCGIEQASLTAKANASPVRGVTTAAHIS